MRGSVSERKLYIHVTSGHLRPPVKWLPIVFLVAFCAVWASQGMAVASNPFIEVEKDHWSYEALAEFAGAGFVEGYSKEAFSGERLITRYEMAWAISRVVPISLNLRQMELLMRLKEEFAQELTFLAGAQRVISPTESGSQQVASGSLGLDSTALTSGLFQDPNSQVISGGKRLSEIIGVEPVESQAAPSTNTQKTLSIPLDAGAKAELSLGGPSVGSVYGAGEGDDVIARLDLKYALSQLAIFRASCELVKESGDSSQDGDASAAKATALLGIDYNFAVSDSAFIKAGYSYLRTTDVPVPKGVELAIPSGSDYLGDSLSKSAGFFGDYSMPGLSLDARKHTASLGVGYTFGGTTSIILGYKLIDFQEVDPESQLPGVHRTNVATAELTIRF